MDIDENNPHRSPRRDLSSNADRELFQAILVGDAPGVSAALARGAHVNARDAALGRTPLFDAVALPERKPAIAELRLARGANVHARDQDGQTPLHAAAISGFKIRAGKTTRSPTSAKNRSRSPSKAASAISLVLTFFANTDATSASVNRAMEKIAPDSRRIRSTRDEPASAW